MRPDGIRLLPAPVRAILQKDFLLLRRDMRNLSQLITPLIFGVILYVSCSCARVVRCSPIPRTCRRSSHRFPTSSPPTATSAWLVRRLDAAGPAVGHGFFVRGQELLDLESLPGPRRSPAGCQVPGGLSAGPGPGRDLHGGGLDPAKSLALPFSYMACWHGMCLAGMNGILLAFGVAGANFNWTDPRRMNAGAIGCLGQFLTALFLPVSFGLFIGPLLLVSVFSWPRSTVTWPEASLGSPWAVPARSCRPGWSGNEWNG